MRIVPVPCLRDNYAYLLIEEGSGGTIAAVVDPSEAEPVQKALTEAGARPVAILCTHHHYDHVGGVPGLLEAFPGLPVYGSTYDKEHKRIPGQTVALPDGERFWPFPGDGGAQQDTATRAMTAMHVPGHTLGALAYVLPQEPAVFTGDTLFLAGCGRMFEGDPAMMHHSLQQLAALPADTRVYCGHEYTEGNLRFAAAVEPENEAVQRRVERTAALRQRQQPTVPGTMAEELATNPFLRVRAALVIQQAQKRLAKTGEPVKGLKDEDIFGCLRHWKDSF